MKHTHSLMPALVLGLAAVGCGSDDDDGGKGKPDACDVRVATSDDDRTTIVEALGDLEPGQTLCLERGTYTFDRVLTFGGKSDITIRGAGKSRDDVVLDFAEQTSGDNGVEVEADGFTIENLTVKDPRGDGIKVTRSDRPTFRNVRAFYSTGSVASNGAYALYPVESTNVLIEDCDVSGSSDAAIYLGQSKGGIVRRNKAHAAVIGIEIENSDDIEVYENEAWDNTNGFLIVNLPALRYKSTNRIKVYDNIARDNNRENFGALFAGEIPRGTGIIVMGANETHVYDNEITGHGGPGLLFSSWPTFAAIGGLPTEDTEFDQYATAAYAHGNTFSGNGQNPQDVWSEAPLNFQTIEDIFWDGMMETGATAQDVLCVKDNGSATFRSLGGLAGVANRDLQSTNVAAHDCTQPALPPVNIPGVDIPSE
ncbi:MAG TPA: parallel beta-helix domain-containing protein [Polyangiaceae bacterium]